MQSGALVAATQVIALVGFAFALLRLWHSGLVRRYPYLAIFLVFRVFHYFPYFFLPATAYRYFFYADMVPAFLTSMMTVRELIGLILERHKGLYTVGRWAMYACIAVSGVISLLSLLLQGNQTTTWIRKYVFPIDRGLHLGLLVFLILMMLWLSRYPVHLSRNIITHACLYTSYFLGSTLGTALATFFGVQLGGLAELGRLSVAPVCAWLWFVLLSAKGEEVHMSVPRFSQEDEERMLFKLDTLNATLLKATRK
jgi:hypothetical protein